MLPLLVIPILICGTLWIKSHPVERAKISAYQGWVIYLYAASYGVIAVFLSWVVAEFLVPWVIVRYLSFGSPELGLRAYVHPDYLSRASKYLALKVGGGSVPGDVYSTLLSSRLLLLSLISIVLTMICCQLLIWFRKLTGSHKRRVIKIYKEYSYIDYQLMTIASHMADRERRLVLFENQRIKNIESARKLKRKMRYFLSLLDEEDREREMERALVTYKKILTLQKEILSELKEDFSTNIILAQITLDSRKVYIGVPRGFKFPDEHGVSGYDVVLYPWYSGYRNERNLSIVITNEYYPLHEKGEEDIDNVVVSKSKVMSASAFSMQHYKEIQDSATS